MLEFKKEFNLLLKNSLSTLGGDRFQEFTKDFLQIYNGKYVGLKRHGGNAEGKTRKGHPDLIKDNIDGTQIAVQCSVQLNYWKKTKKLKKESVIECNG